jgi:hypothetical protein
MELQTSFSATPDTQRRRYSMKMTYTGIVQILGYLVLLQSPLKRRWKQKLSFFGDSAWIHIHSEASKQIRLWVRVDTTERGRPYARTEWRSVDARTMECCIYNVLSITEKITLIKTQTPDKDRPYFALKGKTTTIVKFLTDMSRPWAI